MMGHDLWYKFKCWAWNRYTTVKPRSLPHTWVDRDELLAHCMFEILSRFIEGECSPGVVDWESDEPHKKARAELQSLYDWWHKRYLVEVDHTHDHYTEFLMEHCKIDFNPTDRKDLLQLESTWDSDVNEHVGEELRKQAQQKEKQLEDELKANMKALVDIKDYMWT